MFSVCDGHGQHGHLVSQYIKDSLSTNMASHLQNDEEFLQSTIAFHERVPVYLKTIFIETHQELMTQSKYDCNLSGSTVCAVFFDSKKLFCANVGDSRAVLFS